MSPDGLRLPKAQRLHRHSDFQSLFSQGKRLQTDYLRIYCLRRPDGPPRLGIQVGRKLGSAVRRNRVKRVLRECFRLNQHTVQGLDLLVQVKPGAASLTNCELSTHFLSGLHSLL